MTRRVGVADPMSPIQQTNRQKLLAALELRKQGHTYRQIAELVPYASEASAHRAITNALKLVVLEPAEAVVKLEDARLDALLKAVWDQAMTGDVRAGEQALKIMDRRARLRGLDKADTTGAAAVASLLSQLVSGDDVALPAMTERPDDEVEN